MNKKEVSGFLRSGPTLKKEIRLLSTPHQDINHGTNIMSSNLFLAYKEIPVGSNLDSVVYSTYRTKKSVRGEGDLLGRGAFSISV